jgi:hypothetical protein
MAAANGTEPGAGPGHDTGTRLACHICGRVIRCTEADVFHFIQTGWPRCCGETMTLTDDHTGPDSASPG